MSSDTDIFYEEIPPFRQLSTRHQLQLEVIAAKNRKLPEGETPRQFPAWIRRLTLPFAVWGRWFVLRSHNGDIQAGVMVRRTGILAVAVTIALGLLLSTVVSLINALPIPWPAAILLGVLLGPPLGMAFVDSAIGWLRVSYLRFASRTDLPRRPLYYSSELFKVEKPICDDIAHKAVLHLHAHADRTNRALLGDAIKDSLRRDLYLPNERILVCEHRHDPSHCATPHPRHCNVTVYIPSSS